MTKDEIKKLKGESVNKSFASTSYDRFTAKDYADKAFDSEEGLYAVFMNVKVKKGTPIADTRKLLGTSGMKGYEKEVTIGRNTKWKYSNLKRITRDGDVMYTVDVEVSK